jgi:hypothetical protein
MYAEWKDEPPMAPWVTGFLGFKPPHKAVNPEQIFALFPSGVISLEAANPMIH